MKRAAICLSGAMSKMSGRFLTPQSLYDDNPYVNFIICFNSLKKHIVEANPDYIFDFYIHSWNEDLKNNLIDLYNPKKYIFENAYLYNTDIIPKMKSKDDFGGISKSISMKKSINLVEEYLFDTGYIIKYDVGIVYRPDLFLCKNINLNNYNLNKIYVNGHDDSEGDFHFIMNLQNLFKFKNLYDSLDAGNYHRTHYWIKNYVNSFMGQELIMDSIIPGKDQEVIRKIYEGNNSHINIDLLNTYT